MATGGSIFTQQSPAREPKTYHVTPGGSDAQPGSREQPFRSIQHAADIARPGDTVLVHAGVYREAVEIKNSGVPDAPVTFRGQRGADGQWLTILDRSEPVTGWEEAPEIGPGVFKTREPGFNPACMTLEGKLLARIHDKFMRGNEGRDILTVPADALVKTDERIQRSARLLDYSNHTLPCPACPPVISKTRHRISGARRLNRGDRDQIMLCRGMAWQSHACGSC